MPGFSVLHYLWEFFKSVPTESVMPSNQLILCQRLLLLPSIFPRIGVFSNELALCIRWPKYWSFSFNISPSKEYSGPISFRIDWFELLAVEGMLKSLFQYHSSKASILWLPAFMVQLWHPYMTTKKKHGFDYMDLCWKIIVKVYSNEHLDLTFYRIQWFDFAVQGTLSSLF